ncbi:MAG: Hsp20/alpha crystallin family protein [Kangiellaceae bacterium]|jgi:HSP20 family protein|nr:Hsp20/alpha crystallin family protein [Kangiellaceae bacterium]
MNLSQYKPWSMFDRWTDLDDLMAQRMAGFDSKAGKLPSQLDSDWQLRVDVKELTDHFLIKADIPGVKPEDIDVSAKNGVLTIKGERQQEFDESLDGVHRIERSFGRFSRSFNLPQDIKLDAISAKSVDGVLQVTLPKVMDTKAQKIEIKS